MFLLVLVEDSLFTRNKLIRWRQSRFEIFFSLSFSFFSYYHHWDKFTEQWFEWKIKISRICFLHFLQLFVVSKQAPRRRQSSYIHILSRVSRRMSSHCIGLRENEEEILLLRSRLQTKINICSADDTNNPWNWICLSLLYRHRRLLVFLV